MTLKTCLTHFKKIIPQEYKKVDEPFDRLEEKGVPAEQKHRWKHLWQITRGGCETMGKATGFLEYEREDGAVVPAKERIKNFKEFHGRLNLEKQRRAGCAMYGLRCTVLPVRRMISGMASGCPLHNLVPETNDLVYTGNLKQAYRRLSKTHPFPEFTCRVCPALCEAACTCNLNGDPVSTKENEKAIIEAAFKEGWVQPIIPKVRSGKSVAVIGSGPSGLAAAQLA